MPKRFSTNYAILSIALDASLTLLALVIAVTVRPNLPQLPLLVTVEEISLPVYYYILVPSLWALIFLLASVYDPKRNLRLIDEYQAVALATGIATLVCAFVFYLFYREFSRWLFAVFVILNLAFLLGWRAVARGVERARQWPPTERRVLIIGAGTVGLSMREMIRAYNWTGLQFVGYLDDDLNKRKINPLVLGALSDVRTIVEHRSIDDVIIALPQSAHGRINELVVDLHKLPVHVRVIPDYFSLSLHGAAIEDFGGVPMIDLREPAMNDVQRMVKRMIDLVFSGPVALITLPFMGLIALAVKLDSPGPALFRQPRVGENGQLFTMYKFRSMKVGAEKLEGSLVENDSVGPVFNKSAHDPRVTRLGRFIRRTSLDELPQLYNVIRGDMSLVGPRPELPWLVHRYEPWQRKRFAVPQGLTGWWQVNGRADRPMYQHTEDDLYYIQNYSIWLDLYILLRTVFVVLKGSGAY